MVQIISGNRGKGKTRYLLEKVNSAIKEAHGSICYLDKNTKHMFELNNKIRLIDVSSYPIHSYEGFLGFVCGIISQDHDLEQMYFDSFLKIAHVSDEDIEKVIKDLIYIGEKFDVVFVLSISRDNEHLPEIAREKTIIAL